MVPNNCNEPFLNKIRMFFCFISFRCKRLNIKLFLSEFFRLQNYWSKFFLCGSLQFKIFFRWYKSLFKFCEPFVQNKEIVFFFFKLFKLLISLCVESAKLFSESHFFRWYIIIQITFSHCCLRFHISYPALLVFSFISTLI